MSVPVAVVLVQVTPPEAAREHAALLTTACTQGLRQGACVLIGAVTPDPRAVLAEVTWQGEFRVAEVRVGTPSIAREQWASGTVTFDERDDAVKAVLAMAIQACRKAGKYIGICGQGPSDHPDLARWLLEQGIESMSLNPDTVVETWLFLANERVVTAKAS